MDVRSIGARPKTEPFSDTPNKPSTGLVARRKLISTVDKVTTDNIAKKKDKQQRASVSAVAGEDESEIERLKNQLRKYERKVAEVQTERDTYLFQINELNKLHKTVVADLTKNLEESNAKREEMRERLDRVEDIENAIVRLWMEMKDRSAERVPRNAKEQELFEQREQREREELLKKNPLVTLSNLSARLRTLFAFKEDYENELKGQIDKRKSETELQMEELKQRMARMEKEKADLLRSAAEARRRAEDAEQSKEREIRHSESVINTLREDNQRLLALVRESQEEIDRLNVVLNKRDEILRHKETKMMKIAQLESQIQKDKIKHQFDINKYKAQNHKTSKIFEKELAVFTKMQAEKKEMEEKLRQMEKVLHSYKTDANRTKVLEYEQKLEKVERQLAEKEAELKRKTDELTKAQHQVTHLQKKNAEMKQEYDKIFMAAVREKQERAQQQERALREQIEANHADLLDKNPRLAGVLRELLQTKEREVEDLNKRVKRMILNEHRGNIMEKNFEIERSRLLGELASLRRHTAGSSSTTGSLRSRSPAPSLSTYAGGDSFYYSMDAEELRRRNRELEETLRDYNNLKTIATTTAAAYERLKREVASGNIGGTGGGGGGVGGDDHHQSIRNMYEEGSESSFSDNEEAQSYSPQSASTARSRTGSFYSHSALSGAATQQQQQQRAGSPSNYSVGGGDHHHHRPATPTTNSSSNNNNNSTSTIGTLLGSTSTTTVANTKKRPLSAGPRRPYSARNRQLTNIGTSHSTLRVGSLVRPHEY